MRGGKRSGSGRPAGLHRSIQKQIRWTPEEWDIVSAYAETLNVPVSEFIRDAALQAASRLSSPLVLP
jgi:hypothetical protein